MKKLAIAVEMPSDRWQIADRTTNPRDYIHAMTVANDGKTAVFEARGDIFAVATDDSRLPRNLSRTPGTRERFPTLSPDGTRVAFYSDKSGDYQIYVTDTSGDKPWEQLTTTLDRTAYHLEWSPDGSKLLFGNKDFSLFVLDLASKKLTKFASSNQMKNDEFFWEVSDYSWSPDGKWVAYSFVQFNRNNRLFLYNLDENKSVPVTDAFYDGVTSVDKLAGSKSLGSRLNLDQLIYRVSPVSEWTQIFNDAWRWYRDFFYDENMHGQDWKKIGDKFRLLLPDLTTRADLNWVLSQMVGELNVSHTYVGGGDMGPVQLPVNPVYTGLLGADLKADPSGYPKLSRILGPTAYNRDLVAPLSRPDVDVKDGDFVIAIDGNDLKGANPYRFTQVIRGQKVKVTVNATPSATGAKTYEVELLRSESDLRYNRWIADNIDTVLKVWIPDATPTRAPRWGPRRAPG